MAHPLIPDFILNQYRKKEFNGSFKGYTIIIDIKGYTSYTQEIIKNHPTEGVELISELLNQLFGPQVQIIYDFGAFIPYFAGDAYTIIFPSENSNNTEEVVQLCRELRSQLHENEKLPKDKLGIKISLDYGDVHWLIDGEEDSKFYLFYGPLINQTAELNAELSKNEIRLGANLASTYTYEEKGNKAVQIPEIIDSTRASWPEEELLELFYPQIDNILNARNEFRDVISIFVRFGFEEEIDVEALKSCVQWCRKYQIHIKEIESGDKGLMLFGFLGAPTTFINLKKRAISWALDCSNSLREMKGLKFKIAMNLGRVYCGFIGGAQRLQYGIVGHSVNCASRFLKIGSDNSIIIDKSMIISGVDIKYETTSLLKGVEKPIDLYSVRGLDIRDTNRTPLLGRDKEFSAIKLLVAQYEMDEANENLLILGEAGVGKSRLLQELKKHVKANTEVLYVSLYCNEIDYSAFLPFINYLKAIFDFRPGFVYKTLERRIQPLTKSLNALEQKRILEVFAILLGLPFRKGFFKSLDAQSQFNIIKESFINFFKAFSSGKKLIIKIDDIQWIDYATISLLKDLNNTLDPLLIFSSRPHENAQEDLVNFLFEDLEYQTIQLYPIGFDAVKGIVEYHQEQKVDDESVEVLLAASNGNPFFLDQIIKYVSETEGWLQKDGALRLKSKEIELKDGMQSVLLSRIDRLDFNVREAVKHAAVLGLEFEENIFSTMLKMNGENQLNGKGFQHVIGSGLENQVWRRLENNRYVFSHALLRDAIYNMQATSDLKQKHLVAAQAIETEYADRLSNKYFSLLHHYEKAQRIKEYKKYLLLVADYSKENYRSYDALKFYNRYLKLDLTSKEKIKAYFQIFELHELLGAWDEAGEVIQKVFEILESDYENRLFLGIAKRLQGQHLTLLGDYERAEVSLQEAMEIFEHFDDKKGTISCLDALGTLCFRQSDYPQAVIYFEGAVELVENMPNSLPNFSSIGKLGLTFMNLGELEKGINILEQYLKSPDISKLEECVLSINIGIIKQEYGDFDGSEYNFHNGLHIAQLIGNKRFLSIAYGSLGSIYLLNGRDKLAWEYLEADLSITNELGDKQGKSIVYGLLGEYHLYFGNANSSFAYFKKQHQIASELGYTKGVLKSVAGTMEAHFKMGDYEKIQEIFDDIPENYLAHNSTTFNLLIPLIKAAILGEDQASYSKWYGTLERLHRTINTPYTGFYKSWFENFNNNREHLRTAINEYFLNNSIYNSTVYIELNKNLMNDLRL